jgi:hypothetical protein
MTIEAHRRHVLGVRIIFKLKIFIYYQVLIILYRVWTSRKGGIGADQYRAVGMTVEPHRRHVLELGLRD